MKRTLLNLASALFVSAVLGGGILSLQASENQSFSAELQSQIQVNGKVVDASGQPLIGVTVVQAGNEANGSMTDLEGGFTLTVPQGSELIVSYIGYKTVTVAASQGAMTITLEEDTVGIDDVVVVGYGVQKKANVSGAVSTVKMDDVLGDRPAPNVASALQGSMPGLTISANGNNPGQTSKSIQIRGTETFSNNSRQTVPTLIIIDNVEVTADDMNALSPNDIESVTVLKDASSASIYGARAAGGVILITTKRPQKAEKIRINYNNNFGFVNATSTPRQLGISEYLPIWREAFGLNQYSAAGQDIDRWLEYVDMYKKGNIAGLQAKGTYDPETGIFLEGDSKNVFYYLKEQDIYERMMETSFSHNHNVSVTGATEHIRFRMSGNSYSENGPLVGDKDKYGRMSFNGNISADIAKWFTQEADFSYSQQKRSNITSDRLYSLRLQNFLPEGMAPFTDYQFNTPLSNLQHLNPTNTTINIPRVFLKSVIKPLKGLEAVFEYTYTKNTTDQTRYRQQWTGYSFQEGTEQALSLGTNENDFYLYNSKREKNAFNAYATYKFNIADDHNFSVMAGFSQEKLDYSQYSILAINQLVPSVPSLSAAEEVQSKSDYYYEYAIRSGLFRVNYDYKGKYIFEVSGRYDGSSKFPKKSRFAFFPSFSVAWNLAEEKFMIGTRDYIDQIKPRFSYGSIGNQQNAGYYDYIQSMTIDAQYNNWLNGNDTGYVGGISVPGATSADFTWETITTTNVGLDFAFFNSRLNGTFEWYQRDTKDILSTGIDLPATFGTVAPNQNVGSLRTRGWELSLNWRDTFANNKGHYNIGLSLWDYKTKITKILGNPDMSLGSMYTGQTMGELWGYVWDGFYTKDDFEDLSSWKLKEGVPTIQGTTPQPGDFKFKNLADNQMGEGVTDENQINAGLSTLDNPGDRKVIGNSSPRYQYGINLGVGYAGFDLSVMLQGIGKRDWAAGNNQLIFTGNGEVWLPVFEGTTNYWKPMSTDPTDPNYMVAENPNAKLPRIYGSMGNRSSNSRNSDYMLQDASYLRLKNITLSYTFPKKWMDKIYISNLRLFVSVENAATFSKLPRGIDPELLGWAYPMYRTVSFGLNVTF